ncbi:glycolate oxidase subunit GlcE [Granulosicoccaceae sp. 1_MG-2023]|nr:glycolate oxidase subunit GlcE [Granulosicoccaceae sp. 1_MG-2023]
MSDNTQPIRDIVASVLQAAADKQTLTIRGGGTQQFHTGLVHESTALRLDRYTGIISYEPSELVITVRAGTPLRSVESMLASRGQQFAFEPPRFGPNATIGGMVATGLSGPRRSFSLALRDAVLGIKIINGKGEVLSFGGEVIKNVAGYDVSRLFCGSYGTLGVILEVSLRVMPRPPVELTVVRETRTADACQAIQSVRQQVPNLSGLAYDSGRLYCRLAGSEASVAKSVALLGGEVSEQAAGFWRQLKDQELPFFREPGPLWRVSVPPAAPQGNFGARFVYDWGGGLRWIKTDATAEQVRAGTGQLGGSAVLFRSEESRLLDVSASLSAPAIALHRRLKSAFDPMGVFNPGLLFPAGQHHAD